MRIRGNMYKFSNGWTKQKVMEQIRKYNDGTPAVGNCGNCLYEDNKGNRCAIGCFIPDGHPGLQARESDVVALLIRFPDLQDYLPFSELHVLNDFQVCHDACAFDPNKNVHISIENFLNEKVEE